MALSRGLRLHLYLVDWLIRSQSGGSPREHSDSGRPNQSLGWIITQKSELKPSQVFFVCGLRIPSRFSPCKTHSREMAQLQDLILRLKSKLVLTPRCLMSLIGLLANGKNGPGGTPSHEALSVSSQGALEISSVAGQPPSLDRSHCSTLRPVAKSLQSDERCRPSSQDHSIQLFTDASTKVGALT